MPWWHSSPASLPKLSLDLSPNKKSSSSPSAVSSGSTHRRGFGPRLTRQRKLRHLRNRDLGLASARYRSREPSPEPSPSSRTTEPPPPPPPRSPEPASLPRSSDPLSRTPSFLENSSPRPSPAVPQPLPLPEFWSRHRRDALSSSNLNFNSSFGDCRLPSPREASSRNADDRDRDRDRDRGDALIGDGTGSRFTYTEARKPTEHFDLRSPRKVKHDVKSVDSLQEKFKLNGPARSAPSSPFASPLLSPQRMSMGDIFQSQYTAPQGLQVWSAPEMLTEDPMLASPEGTTFSLENSPLHSPTVRSPRQYPKSPSGPASPLHPKSSLENTTLHPKLSLEGSVTRRDGNGHANVHPLPLPPGAALPWQAAAIPQVGAKSELLPMTTQWQKGKLIGRGTFGSVYVATNRETGALCAMKEVELFPDDPKSAESIRQLEQEIKVLSQLKHPNIVQYYGSEIVEDRFYIYLEYVYPGSISKYVREHCGAITESVVRNFTRHILSGLAYLHSTKTIHRDIKGANLLVDASGVVKLADFGMAKHLTGHIADLSLKGSPYWMAPELMQAVMQKDKSTDLAFAVDIWSLGCTIIEMLNGKPPWSEYEGAAAMFKVMRESPSIPETLSLDGKDFLCCCFQRNPAERPTANKLLEHRFLRNSQQLDVPSFAHAFSGMKLTDNAHSPREHYIFRLDPLTSPSTKRVKGKVASQSSTFTHSSFSPVGVACNHILKLPT